MAKTGKALWTILLLWLIVATTPAFSDEGRITQIVFKMV